MQKAAIFDFNGTLLPYDFGPLLLKYHRDFFNKKSTMVRTYVKFAISIAKYKLFKSYTKEQFHVDAFDELTYTLKGFDKDKIDEFFEYCGKKFSKLMDEDILLELDRAKKNGYYTVILSGTYTQFLNHLISHIGIDKAIGSDLDYITVDGKEYIDYSKKLDVVKNETKALRVKELLNDIDYKNSIAYADSYFDKPILDLVGTPICVNPDEQLLEIAKHQNYQILYTKYKNSKMK